MPRNEPLSLTLPAELVDALADYARADAEVMREAVALAVTGDPVRHDDRERERTTLAHALAFRLLNDLPKFSAQGDLADALNERDEVYQDYRRSQPRPSR